MITRIFTFCLLAFFSTQSSAHTNCASLFRNQRDEEKRQKVRKELYEKLSFTQKLFDFLELDAPMDDWTFRYGYGRTFFNSPRNLQIEIVGADLRNIQEFFRVVEAEVERSGRNVKDDDFFAYGGRLLLSIYGARDYHSATHDPSIEFYLRFGPNTKIHSLEVSKDIFATEIATKYQGGDAHAYYQKLTMTKSKEQIKVTISRRGGPTIRGLVPKVRTIYLPRTTVWEENPIIGNWVK